MNEAAAGPSQAARRQFRRRSDSRLSRRNRRPRTPLGWDRSRPIPSRRRRTYRPGAQRTPANFRRPVFSRLILASFADTSLSREGGTKSIGRPTPYHLELLFLQGLGLFSLIFGQVVWPRKGADCAVIGLTRVVAIPLVAGEIPVGDSLSLFEPGVHVHIEE